MVAFVASTVLTAAALNTAFNALTIRTVVLTSDTLVLADNGGAVTYSNASATTSTIPPNSSVAYATGTKIVLANLGAGVVTVTAGSGVTVNGTLTIAQNAGGTCLKTATNTWQFLPFGSAGAATLTSADVTSTTGSPTITTSGANTIYQFTGSGTFVTSKAGLVAAVVIGGGGAGGRGFYGAGGGGGAGGYLELSGTAYLLSGTSTVTIGAGGSGVSARDEFAAPGVTSRLGSFYVVGGGVGSPGLQGTGSYGTGMTGGSGGGGGASTGGPTYNGVGGAGVGGIGFAGGNGLTNAGGGGGGGSAVGVTAPSGTIGGAGGAGTASSITGSSVTRGGGGGGGAPTTGGAGGAGGGGAGSANATATNGSANLGGGGGGAGSSGASTYDGGNGGSGIVIISVTT